MLSRRNFIGASSLALAGAACGTNSGAGASTTATPATAAVPPSIAGLASMQQLATPIAIDERRGRLERARALMRDHGSMRCCSPAEPPSPTSPACGGATAND